MAEKNALTYEEPVVTHQVHHVDRLSPTSSATIAIHSTGTSQLFPDDQLFPSDQLYPGGSISYDQADLALPATRLRIAHLSPSFKVLQRLLENPVHLDTLTWHEFEELVADLLE